MTAQEEQEGYKIIANFLEWKEVVHDGEEKEFYIPEDLQEYDWMGDTWNTEMCLREMKFNVSWNWMMLVIEKIESMGHVTNIGYDSDVLGHICKIYVKEKHWLFGSHTHNKIEAVYTAVIQFINWYNKQQ